MSVSGEFYRKQADLCALSAEASGLSNQRDTLLRARAAWQALADREFRVKAGREQRELEGRELALADSAPAI